MIIINWSQIISHTPRERNFHWVHECLVSIFKAIRAVFIFGSHAKSIQYFYHLQWAFLASGYDQVRTVCWNLLNIVVNSTIRKWLDVRITFFSAALRLKELIIESRENRSFNYFRCVWLSLSRPSQTNQLLLFTLWTYVSLYAVETTILQKMVRDSDQWNTRAIFFSWPKRISQSANRRF